MQRLKDVSRKYMSQFCRKSSLTVTSQDEDITLYNCTTQIGCDNKRDEEFSH